MINLHFIVDDRFLASYTLCSRFTPNKRDQSIVDFQSLAMKRSIDDCLALHGKYPIYEFALQNNTSDYATVGNYLNEFVDELVKTPEFKIIKDQTQACIPAIKNEWDKNFAFTSEFICSLGIKIKRDFDVYITHPGQIAGYNRGDNIIWTYQNDWPNYNTVYLWHEILHSYKAIRASGKVISESIIEIITDNEMRVRLNGGTYPPILPSGHDSYTGKFKLKLLPIWQDYLKNKSTDFDGLLANLKKLQQ